MTDTDPSVTRRTVLQATGAAFVGGVVGAAGTASASHVSPGDSVVTNTLVGKWSQGCPLADRDGVIDAGTTGQVVNICTTDDGDDHALFSPGRTVLPTYWVPARFLDPL